MNKPIKDCCARAINNYRRNKALSLLQEVAKFDTDITKEERHLMMAFMEGMKINPQID